MEHQEAYHRAKEKSEAKFGFYIHLSVYIAVSILLILINLSTSTTQYLWFKWPLMGWGIGVFFHALRVFVFPVRPSVTEKMVEKEMKRKALKKK